MKGMKKILAVGASTALVAALAIGGTFAALTSTDGDVNVMTTGNVKIVQNEQQRVENAGQFTSELEEFKQGKILMPVTYPGNRAADTVTIGDYTITLSDDEANYVDKIVSVTNTGSEAAYVRTLVAVPTGGSDWEPTPVPASDCWLHWNIPTDYATHWTLVSTNVPMIEIDGENYYVWEFVHKEAVAPNETTYPAVRGFYMDQRVNNDDNGYFLDYGNGTTKRIDDVTIGDTVDVLVISQAVQAAGFSAATAALDAGFGDVNVANAEAWFNGLNAPVLVDNAEGLVTALAAGEDVVLNADVEAALLQKAIYGTPVAAIQKGGVIDGNGYSLDIENPRYEGYAIETYGGTIKNLTIDSTVGRGIVISNPAEDIYIDNVVIDGPGYAINTTEHNGKNLIVTNSVIKGWTSFAGLDSATFTNCTFGENIADYWQNMGYDQDYDRLVRPYVESSFINCTFENDFYIDLSALGADCTVSLNNCTSDGTVITSDNYADYITIELPDGRTLADCVIFK